MHVTKRPTSNSCFSKLIITLLQEAFLDFSNSIPINFNIDILYVYCMCFIHEKSVFWSHLGVILPPLRVHALIGPFLRRRGLRHLNWQIHLLVDPILKQ